MAQGLALAVAEHARYGVPGQGGARSGGETLTEGLMQKEL
jgi:hypothetical protein